MTRSNPVLVIGAGIAGFSAVQWLRSYGVPFQWLAGGSIGGALAHVRNPIENWPGETFDGGAKLANRLQTQAESLAMTLERGSVTAIERVGSESLRVEVEGDGGRHVRAIVLATGVSPRKHPKVGEPDRARKFVSSQLATRTLDRPRHVLVVGGSDGAFEGALVLRRGGAEQVTIAHRSAEPRAQQQFRDDVRDDDAIDYRTEVELEALERAGDRLRATVGGDVLEVDAVVVKIGFEPSLPRIEPQPRLTDGGYLAVDRSGATSVDGVWAAGDCASPDMKALARAASQGAMAAHTIAQQLGYRD